MNKQIVALSINKVQSMLFDTILSHTQERQAEATSLNRIMTASKEVSVEFVERIKLVFQDSNIKEELLNCSGVYIFQCTLAADDIAEKVNQLFLDYYKKSQGRKQLRYAYFPQEGLSEIAAIQKAKGLLQEPARFSEMIEKNKETLFSFQKVDGADQESRFKEIYECYPKYASSINALWNTDKADSEKHFRMAVIKADLDGMGDLFKQIKDYQEYQRISGILNDCVSLEGLHHIVSEQFPNHRDGWVFPFYVAGDDIFFAVYISDLIAGIDVCRKMIEDINYKIQKKACNYKLSLSVGVEIVINREPVRYYLDLVERQLKNAKSKKSEKEIAVLKDFIDAKISIAGVSWWDINIDAAKQHKRNLRGKTHPRQVNGINQALGSVPVWRFFLDELAILSYVKSKEPLKKNVGTAHSFYTLLETLTDKTVYDDNIKYINHLLYHLLPDHFDSPVNDELWQMELLLNRGIIKQLYKKDDRGSHIEVTDETKGRLEAYLRLMLLFSDDRFQIDGIDRKTSCDFGKDKQENVRKELFNKPMEYLYYSLKRGHGSELLSYFAVYQQKGKNGNHLERLAIDKSMFIKLRRTKKVDAAKAAGMIALQNPASREEIEEKNKELSKAGKKPRYIYFDKEGFYDTAMNCNQWTVDFIESLMLLYEYNSLLRQFKSRCKTTKGRSKI